jgi:hypothetical protein
MTDARLPDKWLDDPILESWDDRTWRIFTSLLMYSNRHGTDGFIRMTAIHRLHPSRAHYEELGPIVMDGFGDWVDGGFQLLWVDLGQSTHEEVETRKMKNREKSRLRREKEKDYNGVPSYTPRDVAGYVGQERLGQDDTF